MAIGPPPLSSNLVSDEAGISVWPKPWANWFTKASQILDAATQSGTTADRPTTNLGVGRPYFDTTLGLPIWWNGSSWRKADGTAA